MSNILEKFSLFLGKQIAVRGGGVEIENGVCTHLEVAHDDVDCWLLRLDNGKEWKFTLRAISEQSMECVLEDQTAWLHVVITDMTMIRNSLRIKGIDVSDVDDLSLSIGVGEESWGRFYEHAKEETIFFDRSRRNHQVNVTPATDLRNVFGIRREDYDQMDDLDELDNWRYNDTID